MFRLRLFGGALIEGPDGPLSGRIVQRRQLALLAFLSLQGRRPTTRDKLLALFWPESDTERARHNLADAVYVIRKTLGEESVLSVGDDLVLDPERVASDATEFEAALASGDLEGAVELYAGTLLDGFHLPGSREFEQWLAGERERLARACARASTELAERCEAAGDPPAAVDWWRRSAALEPHDSRAALGLMRALIAAGDRAGAVRWAATHTTFLKEEYDVEPDPEFAALAEEARRAPAPASADSSPLAERRDRHDPAVRYQHGAPVSAENRPEIIGASCSAEDSSCGTSFRSPANSDHRRPGRTRPRVRDRST